MFLLSFYPILATPFRSAFTKSLFYADKVKDFHQMSMCFMNKAKIDYHQLDFVSAYKNDTEGIKHLKKALDIEQGAKSKRAHSYRLFMAEYYRLAAETYQYGNKITEAGNYLSDAHDIYSEISAKDRYYVRWLYTSAFQEILIENHAEANSLIERSKKITQNSYDRSRIYYLSSLNLLLQILRCKESISSLAKCKLKVEESIHLATDINSRVELAESKILKEIIKFHLRESHKIKDHHIFIGKYNDIIVWLQYHLQYILNLLKGEVSHGNEAIHTGKWWMDTNKEKTYLHISFRK
jgi:tetratricopeptide (TPR) repeat protein